MQLGGIVARCQAPLRHMKGGALFREEFEARKEA